MFFTAPAMTVKMAPPVPAPISWPTMELASRPAQGWDQVLEDLSTDDAAIVPVIMFPRPRS